MVTIGSLWLAILLSAVIVWVLSALFWTVLPHHKSDFKGLSDEESVRSALKPQGLAPGQYWIPWAEQAQMKDPAVVKRYEEGPVAILTVMQPGRPGMGKNMAFSLVYYLVVGIIVAYLTSRTMAVGADYLAVFRVAGTVAWLAYSFAVVTDSIWFGKPWGFTVKHMIDGLVYGLFTGGVFGWLWPGA